MYPYIMSCIDINECVSDTHNCHMNANCTNTNGSFTCACNKGFTGNGVNCTGTQKLGILQRFAMMKVKKSPFCLWDSKLFRIMALCHKLFASIAGGYVHTIDTLILTQMS